MNVGKVNTTGTSWVPPDSHGSTGAATGSRCSSAATLETVWRMKWHINTTEHRNAHAGRTSARSGLGEASSTQSERGAGGTGVRKRWAVARCTRRRVVVGGGRGHQGAGVPSDGEEYDNPRWFRRGERNPAAHQQGHRTKHQTEPQQVAPIDVGGFMSNGHGCNPNRRINGRLTTGKLHPR